MSGFYLPQRSNNFQATSTDFPALTRPFIPEVVIPGVLPAEITAFAQAGVIGLPSS